MKILLFLVAFLALGSTNAEPVIDGLLGGLLGGGGGGGGGLLGGLLGGGAGGGLLGGLLGRRGILGGLLGGGGGGGLLGGLLGGVKGDDPLAQIFKTLLLLLEQILNLIDQAMWGVSPENVKEEK